MRSRREAKAVCRHACRKPAHRAPARAHAPGCRLLDARELHDDLPQSLAAIVLEAGRVGEPPAAASQAEQALNNIAKHAHARSVHIMLAAPVAARA